MDRPTSTRETTPATPVEVGDRTQTIQSQKPKSNDAAAVAATQVARGTPPSSERPAPPPLPIDDPDRYSLVGEHARGGLGRVLRAVDNRLGRTVAVKELLKKSDGAEALFVREALITARLQHPGIVPVIEAGRWPNNEPYYVMKLVEGRSLKELISERHTLEARLGLLPNALAVCEAIGYAHSQDVIHRDVKPANVVVGEFGETVVVDWGLARDGKPGGAPDVVTLPTQPSGSSETISGRVIGTPQYMAPEQARGDTVDARADVYALGALLYELLAGHAPYAGGNVDTILEAIAAGPPRPLAEAQPGVHADLLAIVAKAMARQKSDRYPTGKELAEDLSRFQTGQLVTAQQYSTVRLVRRWIARHRGPVAVAGVATAILLVVAIAMVRSIVEERNIARKKSEEAIAAQRTSEQGTNQLRELQAESSVRRDPTETVAWLKELSIDASNAGKAAALLEESVASGVARHLFREQDFVYAVKFSSDGHHLSTASKDGKVRLYDLTSDPTSARVLGDAGGIHATIFSPDGSLLLTGGDDGRVIAWPTAGGDPRVLGTLDGTCALLTLTGTTLTARNENGSDIALFHLPTGESLARIHKDAHLTDITYGVQSPKDPLRWLAAFEDGDLRLLDRGNTTIDFGKQVRPARALSWSPDGKRGALYDGDALSVIDLDSKQVRVIARIAGPIEMLDWSPDGATIAASGKMNDIDLVPAAGGEVRTLHGHTDAMYSVRWSHDSRRILSASDDTTARVWDLSTGAVDILRGHDDDVVDAEWSPDETMVATASLDHSARVWKVGDRGVRVLGSDVSPIFHLKALDDHTVLTMSSPLEVTRWDLATGRRTTLVPRTDDVFKVTDVTASPAGDVAFGHGHDVMLTRADGSHAVLAGHSDVVAGVGFAGGALYSGSYDGTVRRWDEATGTSTVIARGDPITRFAADKAGDQLLAIAGGKITVYAPDGTAGRSIRVADLPGGGEVFRTGWAPDGQAIVLEAMDGHSSIWWPGTGKVVGLAAGGHEGVAYAFSPDGQMIAGAMADRTVRVWNVATGAMTHTLTGHTDLVMAVAFSPDGKLLASSSYDRTVRVWNLATDQSRVLRGHGSSVEAVTWIENGARLLTGSRDGTLRVWPTPSTETPTPDELHQAIERATTAVVVQGHGNQVETPTSAS